MGRNRKEPAFTIMATDADLMKFVDTLFEQNVPMESVLTKEDGTLDLQIVKMLKFHAPKLNTIYGILSAYNSKLDITYATITSSQMEMIFDYYHKKTKFDLRKTAAFTSLVFGVEKTENQTLSEVTEKDKISCGGLLQP